MAIASKFTDHPNSVDETYLQHMGVALHFSGSLARASVSALVHAVFPWLCCTSASSRVKQMHHVLTTGARAANAEAQDDLAAEQPSAA